jgi:thiamine biosynthesis lipoprotein
MGTTVSMLFSTDTQASADAHAEPGSQPTKAPLERVEAVFSDADSRYSLFRPESELSQIASGALKLSDASEELRLLYELAIGWRNATNGAFTPHRGDGVIDLSGLVKAWAIARSGEILAAHGMVSWCINAGGDVLTAGSARMRPWTVGIVDPDDRGALVASVVMTETHPAVATSGSAERGDHIWTQTAHGAGEYRQVSVLASDIITADVLATAIVAGGREAMDLATSTWPIEVLAVRRGGALEATAGVRRVLATPPEGTSE